MTTNHDPGRGPTKSDLAAQLAACRRELAERRRVGDALRGVAALAALYVPSERGRSNAADRCREWDAIAREGEEGGG
jgi:hypothetical protein